MRKLRGMLIQRFHFLNLFQKRNRCRREMPYRQARTSTGSWSALLRAPDGELARDGRLPSRVMPRRAPIRRVLVALVPFSRRGERGADRRGLGTRAERVFVLVDLDGHGKSSVRWLYAFVSGAYPIRTGHFIIKSRLCQY
jgi:hypothetical protein